VTANPLDFPVHGFRGVVVQGVGNVNAGAVAASCQYGTAAGLQQVQGGLVGIIAAAELCQLLAVRGDHFRAREQFVLHGLDQLVIGQIAITGGLDDRIDNQGQFVILAVQEVLQHIDNGGVTQGSGFYRVDGDVLVQAL